MPYKSQKHSAYMHTYHPEIAKEWDRKYGKKPVRLRKPHARKKNG